jgi:hypothetical protein
LHPATRLRRGTIAGLTPPHAIVVGPSPGDFPLGGAFLNDRGQVFFSATLTDDRDVPLLADGQGNWDVSASHHLSGQSAVTVAQTLGLELTSGLMGRQAALLASAGQDAGAGQGGPSAQALAAFVQKLTAWEPTLAASHGAPSQNAVDALFALEQDALSAS